MNDAADETNGDIMKDFFPLFARIQDKKAVMIGGGRIAARRLQLLAEFSFQLSAVAPDFLPEIEALAAAGRLTLYHRPFAPEDVAEAFLVVAATNDRAVNRQAGLLAKAAGAFVSVADCREESSFFFPALAEEGIILAAVAGDGTDHGAVKQAAAKIREALHDSTTTHRQP